MIKISCTIYSLVLLICLSTPALAKVWHVNTDWGHPSYFFTGDFNGDGLADIASMDGNKAYMKLSTGNDFNNVTWSINDYWGHGAYTFAGDFNGDGLTDIATFHANVSVIKYSTGHGFYSVSVPVSNIWGSPAYTFVNDLHAGNGKASIVTAISTRFYQKFLNFDSSAFIDQSGPTRSPEWFGRYTFFGDFNGDGLGDIASFHDDMVYLRLGHPLGGYRFLDSTKEHGFNLDKNWGGLGYTFVGDFDGDGDSDVASINNGNAFIKRGGYQWMTSAIWPISNLWGSPDFTFSGDFDGDGLPDILTIIGTNAHMKKNTRGKFTD